MTAIPNPPTNVQIETLGPEELRISWALPKEWDDQMFASFLEYRLEISTDTGSMSRMVGKIIESDSLLIDVSAVTTCVNRKGEKLSLLTPTRKQPCPPELNCTQPPTHIGCGKWVTECGESW